MAYNRLGITYVATGIVIQAVKDASKIPYSEFGREALDFLHSEWYEYLCDCYPALKLFTNLKYVEKKITSDKTKYRQEFLESYLKQMKAYRRDQ